MYIYFDMELFVSHAQELPRKLDALAGMDQWQVVSRRLTQACTRYFIAKLPEWFGILCFQNSVVMFWF